MIPSNPLTFELTRELDGAVVLGVRGEVDLATARELRDRLLAEFERHPGLVVDLSGAMLFDGAALRAVHALHCEATRLGRRPPTLRGVRPLLMKAFKATGMHEMFRIEPCPPYTRRRSAAAGRLRAAGARATAQGLPSVA